MHELSQWIEQTVIWLIGAVETSGYLGIFLLMAIESSFVPFPSEIVMIPAGYLVAQGKMELVPALAAGLAGSMVGALFNYWFALYVGRAFMLRFGRYFLLPEEKMLKVEHYFDRHGEITTFVGRLIPGVRQLISVPAGLAKMNLARFCMYTALGAGLWVAILTFFGLWVGRVWESADQEAWKEAWDQYGPGITLGLLIGVVVAVAGYVWQYRRRRGTAATSVAPAFDPEDGA